MAVQAYDNNAARYSRLHSCDKSLQCRTQEGLEPPFEIEVLFHRVRAQSSTQVQSVVRQHLIAEGGNIAAFDLPSVKGSSSRSIFARVFSRRDTRQGRVGFWFATWKTL